MKLLFISLGCDKNLVDSEMMMGLLHDRGYEFTDNEEEADIIVINTCGFINDAKEESINTILEMAKYKEKNLKALIVAGCLVERYKNEILQELPEIDAIVGTTAFDKICDVVDDVLADKKHNELESINKMCRPDVKRIITTGGYYSYLKIAEGCDKHCTYCSIPMIRGAYRSVPMDELVKEAEYLADNGVKELIIVAQEITVYGKDLYGEKKLPELLHRLCKIPGIQWIRLLYCYPEEITDELIETIRTEKKICHYIDMPIQHASDKILKAMGRRTNNAELRNIISKLRKEIPDICLRTTLITGFPGETEEDFEDTLDIIRKVKYDQAFTFIYSKRTGTPAATMDNQVPEDVIKERFNRLLTLVNEISNAQIKRFADQVKPVLVEEVNHHDASLVTGRTEENVTVHFPGTADMIGTTVDVKLTDCKGFYFMGERIG